jgi:hypothetical protein
MQGFVVGRRPGRLVALVVAVGSFSGFAVSSASAAALTITVTGTGEASPPVCLSDACPSLRAAVNLADSNPGSTIELGGGTYTLSAAAGALDISASMAIQGVGPGQTTIEQTVAGDGVIGVSSGTVAISGVTTSGGSLVGASVISGANGSDADGGGISNAGTLTLTDDTVSGNSATGGSSTSGTGGNGFGGGVFSSGTLTLTDDTVGNNSATGGDSTSGSGGDGEGGGVYNSGTLTVTDSTFSQNSGGAGSGGPSEGSGAGGAILSQAGTLNVEGSTIGPANTSVGGGGIVSSSNNPSTIVDTTIFGNTATGSPGLGGGLAVVGHNLSLSSDTIDANAGPGGVGNLLLESGTVTLADTIIANGVGSSSVANCVYPVGSTIVDGGNNLESDTTSQCGLIAMSDLLVSNAALAVSLGANGGATLTLALLPGAPEIGAGGACLAPSGVALTLDQRGLPRPAACDIGAFQSQLPADTAVPQLSGLARVGQGLSCSRGTWTGDGPLSAGVVGPLSFSYQWLRATSPIAGAIGSSYTVQAADVAAALACRVTATGAYGDASATSAQSATVPPVGGPPPPPKISAVTQSASKWVESNRLASISKTAKKLPVGTKFSFQLSEAARVTFAFTGSVAGRKVGRRCVPPTKHNAKQRLCTQTVTVGTLTFAGHSGPNRVRFAGRISKRVKLKPGSYVLVIKAIASQKSSTVHRLKFTIATPQEPKPTKHGK